MYCLGILDSGNYVFRLGRLLKSKGYPVEIVSTPCKIAKDGCGFCLRFPLQYKDIVINEGIEAGTFIREIYEIVNVSYKNVYKKIYP